MSNMSIWESHEVFVPWSNFLLALEVLQHSNIGFKEAKYRSRSIDWEGNFVAWPYVWDSKSLGKRQFLWASNFCEQVRHRYDKNILTFFFFFQSFSTSASSLTPISGTALSSTSYILFLSLYSYFFHLLFANILYLVLFLSLLLFNLLHRLLTCLQPFLIFFLLFFAFPPIQQTEDFLKQLRFRLALWKVPVQIPSRSTNNLVKNFRFYTYFAQSASEFVP